MGDIAFNIEKLVDLNKLVTLDIDKNVDVTVDNPDILATAEADAEAIGPNALAEVDAYTYVNVTPDGEPCIVDIDIDAVGNSTPFTFADGSFVAFEFEGTDYEVFNTVEQNFTTQIDGLPTVAALTWTGGLANEGNPPITEVTQLPAEGIFEPENDKVWELDEGSIEGEVVDGNVLISADYNLDSWTVDLGTRDIVCEGTPYTGDLSLEITDATYLVGYLDEDALAGARGGQVDLAAYLGKRPGRPGRGIVGGRRGSRRS